VHEVSEFLIFLSSAQIHKHATAQLHKHATAHLSCLGHLFIVLHCDLHIKLQTLYTKWLVSSNNIPQPTRPGLLSILYLASRAPFVSLCTVTNSSLPDRVLWILADPPRLVMATQSHFIEGLVVPLMIPLLGQGRHPNRHLGAVRLPFLKALGAASPLFDGSGKGRPVVARSLIRRMTLRTHPKVLRFAAFGHLGRGGGVVRVPLFRQPGVFGHGLALAKAAAFAFTAGADFAATRLGQVTNLGLPLVVPAAAVEAAWAPQPHPFLAPAGEVRRLVAQVEVWVPPGLDEVVIQVGKGLFALGVQARTCNASTVRIRTILRAARTEGPIVV